MRVAVRSLLISLKSFPGTARPSQHHSAGSSTQKWRTKIASPTATKRHHRCGRMRDEVRAAHETATKNALTGPATPKQIPALQAQLDNAPNTREEMGPVDHLTAEKVSDWIAKLLARDVLPAPSEWQLAVIKLLCEKNGLSLSQAALRAELPGLTSIRSRGEASAIIEALSAQLEGKTASGK